MFGFLPAALRARWRARLLHRLGATPPQYTFAADGLWTVHHLPFLSEPRFVAAYEAGAATDSWGGEDVRFRAYVALWAARQALHLEGDFVECGVNRGALATMQMRDLDFARLPKKYWLADTFAGFPAEQRHLVSRAQHQERYTDCFEAVQQTFAPYPNARLVRGVVPAVLPQIEAERVCYLSLDLNSAEPEIAALEHFWPRLVPGALVVADDYAYFGYEQHTLAYDDFARRSGVPVLGLPTGQGILIKPPPGQAP